MIRSTHGSRYLAAYRWHRLRDELGAAHPATVAALGRLRVYRGDVPQRDSRTVQAIAWERESGRRPGYQNRGARRALRRANQRLWLDIIENAARLNVTETMARRGAA